MCPVQIEQTIDLPHQMIGWDHLVEMKRINELSLFALPTGTKTNTSTKKPGVVNPGFLLVRRDHQLVWTLPAALKSPAGLYPESCRFFMCVS